MRKILIVDMNPTVPVYTAFYCNALNKHGESAYIYGIKLDKEIDELNLKYIKYVKCFRFKYKKAKHINYIFNWIKLLIINRKYNIIHIQWLPGLRYSKFELILLKALCKLNKNVYYTIHNLFPHNNKDINIESRYIEAYKLIPNLIVHTEKTKNNLNKYIEHKSITVMPHGPLFEISFEEIELKQDNIISIIGVISRYKGIEDAIKLISDLKRDGVEIKLILAGKCEETYINEINMLIKKEKIEENVIRIFRYLSLNEILELHKRSKATLATYKNIDQSGAVITSLALGVPVLGYKVGGISELIKDRCNGYLVEKDNINELKKATKWILNKNSITLSENCLKEIENISWKKSINIIMKKYWEE